MKKILWLIPVGIAVLAVGLIIRVSLNNHRGAVKLSSDYEKDASISKNNAGNDSQNPENNAPGLGAYNVLIADRGNNRVLEVSPDKKILWQYNFSLPHMGLGADDSFFYNSGKNIIVNLEEYQEIQKIDFNSKKVIWTYGVPGVAGHTDGYLNTPDDAYQLPNGDITVADIKNCRVIEISPDKKIVRQYGVTKVCGSKPGLLNAPNGDTPLPDGGVLISNIRGSTLVELDNNWHQVLSMKLPVNYPSDPQLMKNGDILVADYSKPGKIVEVSKTGQIVWEYGTAPGEDLSQPSLAIELPNGNIMANDDLNHRVIVIDKKTKKIDWQYGVTGQPGNSANHLNIPDGVDVIPAQEQSFPADNQNSVGTNGNLSASSITSGQNGNLPILAVGQVSRHAGNYINKTVKLSGYVLQKVADYIIISDEPSGAVGYYDLPVTGSGIASLGLHAKYIFYGQLKFKGLNASNGNPYHLELYQASE